MNAISAACNDAFPGPVRRKPRSVPNAARSRNTERGNLNIQFGDAASLDAPLVSDEWRLGGRSIRFVQLGPDAAIGLDQSRGRIFAKVVTGSLAHPARNPF